MEPTDKHKDDIGEYRDLLIVLPMREPSIFRGIIWLCLTRTGNYQVHEFDWLKSILTAV